MCSKFIKILFFASSSCSFLLFWWIWCFMWTLHVKKIHLSRYHPYTFRFSGYGQRYDNLFVEVLVSGICDQFDWWRLQLSEGLLWWEHRCRWGKWTFSPPVPGSKREHSGRGTHGHMIAMIPWVILVIGSRDRDVSPDHPFSGAAVLQVF